MTIENGKAYADYHLSAVQSSQKIRSSGPLEQNKLPAEVKNIDGSSFLVFTTKAGNEYRWTLNNSRLVGRPSAAGSDSTCTLSKAK